MDYVSNLLLIFNRLFSAGVQFMPIIGLITVSGVVGGLVSLTKSMLRSRYDS